MSDTTTTGAEAVVRPFRIDIPQHEIEGLRRRIDATRCRPTKELVTDRSQGVQLAAIQELARYWTTEYDWRKCEARRNVLPQFKTKIDGLYIHFVHVESKHENAMPLIMTHGWPGSIVELLETIGPLTDPTARWTPAEDQVSTWSCRPSPATASPTSRPSSGWGPIRIGQAWHELMRRLGYSRYVAVGRRRWLPSHRRDGPPRADGADRHPHQPPHAGAGRPRGAERDPRPTDEERAAPRPAAPSSDRHRLLRGAGTRPETIGYALLDSPIALAAWMMDHDTDSYQKIARRFVDGEPSGNLTREHILDNITLYWLTGTGASAAWSYWEEGQENAAVAGQAPPPS